MKFNQWTLALASVGIISAGSIAQAEEQHSVMTALQTTTLSGYVDTSVNWWAGSRGGASTGLPGRTFDGATKQDGFNLNAVKLVLEKPLGDENNWSAGYKADLVFGPDADYYASLNNFGGMSADDFSVKQAYVALRAPVGNGLDFKMGVWDTVIGYEFFESGSNPNYSRSYGYALEPTHHTGLLASYKISDMVSLTAGVANGWTGPVNDKNAIESKKAYMGALTITLPEGAGSFKNSVISVGAVNGRNTASFGAAGGAKDTTSLYAGATFNTPVEGLQFGLAWDYREDSPFLGAGTDNDAYAGALYVSFGQDKWKLNLRADYTQATDGTFYVTGTPGGDRNELGSLTATIDYSLWENVLTRLEARYDRALSGDKPFGTADESAFTLALNAIYKF